MTVGWLSLTEARARWRDAPADDAQLQGYLDGAQAAIVAYAPAVPGVTDVATPTADVPAAYRQAQWMQARNVRNAGITPIGSGGDGLDDGGRITAYPLDWTVKQLLRPQQPIGAVA